jgi:hypothetical protein
LVPDFAERRIDDLILDQMLEPTIRSEPEDQS